MSSFPLSPRYSMKLTVSGARPKAWKTILSGSAKPLQPDSKHWKSRSSKVKSRSKKRSAESKLPRKKRRRRKRSLRRNAQSWRLPKKERDSSNCSWKILGTTTLRMMKAQSKRHQLTARSCLEMVVNSLLNARRSRCHLPVSLKPRSVRR